MAGCVCRSASILFYCLRFFVMNKATDKANRPPITSPCGDELEVCLSVDSGTAQTFPHTVQTLPLQSPSQYRPVPITTCPANAFNDRNKPSIRLAATNLTFLISNSFHSEVVARRLIHLADVAYFNRRDNELEHVSEALSRVHRYDSIAAYYQGILAQRRKDHSKADELFRHVVLAAPAEYQARALVSLGASDVLRGNARAYHYAQALRRSEAGMATRFRAANAIGTIYALSGEHYKAIEQLESLYPIARRLATINPRCYFDYLNSLAVEYSAVGRHEDARAAFNPVHRSSLFNSITEYQETERELREQESRAVIVAAPNVRNCAQREEKQASASERIVQMAAPQVQAQEKKEEKQAEQTCVILHGFLFRLDAKRNSPLIVLAIAAKTSIQSRLRHSIQPHAPPILSGE